MRAFSSFFESFQPTSQSSEKKSVGQLVKSLFQGITKRDRQEKSVHPLSPEEMARRFRNAYSSGYEEFSFFPDKQLSSWSTEELKDLQADEYAKKQIIENAVYDNCAKASYDPNRIREVVFIVLELPEKGFANSSLASLRSQIAREQKRREVMVK